MILGLQLAGVGFAYYFIIVFLAIVVVIGSAGRNLIVLFLIYVVFEYKKYAKVSRKHIMNKLQEDIQK